MYYVQSQLLRIYHKEQEISVITFFLTTLSVIDSNNDCNSSLNSNNINVIAMHSHCNSASYSIREVHF